MHSFECFVITLEVTQVWGRIKTVIHVNSYPLENSCAKKFQQKNLISHLQLCLICIQRGVLFWSDCIGREFRAQILCFFHFLFTVSAPKIHDTAWRESGIKNKSRLAGVSQSFFYSPKSPEVSFTWNPPKESSQIANILIL